MAENITEISQLHTNILIETIQEGLHNCAYVWNKIGPTTFKTDVLIDGIVWGVVSNKVNETYYLDIFKSCTLLFSLSTQTHPSIQQIFVTLEEKFSPLVEEENDIIAALNGECVRLCPPKFYIEKPSGGVVVGGSIVSGIIDGCRCNNTDILLVIDTTGSMGGLIAQFALLLVEVLEVMDSPTCKIGLVTYKDYEDGEEFASGWRVDSPFTFDFSHVSSLVSTLGVSGGGDGPEQNLSALKLAADEWLTTLGGREDANKTIAWAGDIQGWASGAKGYSYPSVSQVISSLNNKSIQVVALNGSGSGTGLDGGSSSSDPPNQATDITNATNGTVIDNVLSLPLDDVIQIFCDSINVSGEVSSCNDIVSNGTFESDLTEWDTTGDVSWSDFDFSDINGSALRIGKGGIAEQTIESLIPGYQISLSYDWCLRNETTVSMLNYKKSILNPDENPEIGFPAVGKVGSFVAATLDYFCSGTLITPRHVLTAAHCVDDLLDDEARVDFGGTSYSSSKIYVHPSWTPSSINTDLANDIAIIELDSDVTGITPIPISGPEPLVGDPIKLVGFGFFGDDTGFSPGTYGTKRSGDQQVDQYTTTLLRFYFDVPGEASTAPGDSGGALLYEDGGQWYVTALVSGGAGSGSLGLGTTLFNTRVTAYETWILETINSKQTIISELRDSSGDPLTLLPGSGSYSIIGETPSCDHSDNLIALVPSDGIIKIHFELEGEVTPNTHNLYIDNVELCYSAVDAFTIKLL